MGLGFSRPIDRHLAQTEESFRCFLSKGIEVAKDQTKYALLAESAGNPNQKKALAEGCQLANEKAAKSGSGSGACRRAQR